MHLKKIGLTLLMLSGISASAATDKGAKPAAAFSIVQPDTFKTPGGLVTAWADYDGDGDPDLAVAYTSGEVRLYRNDSGKFVSVGGNLGFPLKGEEARAAAWVDYNADGRPDLFISTHSRKYLYRNDGGKFTEVARAVGIDDGNSSGRQPNWIDYDNDGDLDLFLSNRSGPNMLFRNDGGRFTNVAKEVGLDNPMRTVGSCWFDMDKDGDLDVFVSNQDGDTNSLYRNDGGHFVDVAPVQHLDRPGRTRLQGSVGCTIGDFDNDGNFDIFVTEYGVSALYHNDGHGVFTDVAATQGVAIDGHMVAASWADFDNDGLLDLYVAGYVGMGATASSSDRLFRNMGGRFVNVISTSHPLNASDHGVQWADYDGDGDLDLALTEGYPTAGRDPLLRNELPAAQRRAALQVAVVDAQGHATRAGAEVRLFDMTGKLLGSRLVATGDGYDAQSILPAHFGLAKRGRVSVEVTFLTQHGRVTKRVPGVDPGRFIGRALIVKEPV